MFSIGSSRASKTTDMFFPPVLFELEGRVEEKAIVSIVETGREGHGLIVVALPPPPATTTANN